MSTYNLKRSGLKIITLCVLFIFVTGFRGMSQTNPIVNLLPEGITLQGNINYNNDSNLETETGISFMADNLTRMVLNPDVTVRSRGVMEKCSFCVQRIQEGKLTAKREGRRLIDADVRTACQTACPTGAIIFGDRNDKNGDVRKKMDNPLNYLVLEEINVQSSILYGAKVNNRSEELLG